MSTNLFDVNRLIHTAEIADSEEFTNREKVKNYLCSEENSEPYFERLQGILMEMENREEQGIAEILAHIPKCNLVLRSLNILGEYFPDKRSIKYYRQTPETLEIVKIHERFHAMHHLAVDRNNRIWENFGRVDPYYLELLAQLFTYIFIRDHKRELLHDFEVLNKSQPFIYKTYKMFRHYDKREAEDLYWDIRKRDKTTPLLLALDKIYSLMNAESALRTRAVAQEDKMTKKEILQELKVNCDCSTIKLPGPINVSIDQDCLILEIPEQWTHRNMQTDSAAFDGWAIVLKRWIKRINGVIVRWYIPEVAGMTAKQMQHYRRFLYRAKRFSEAYSWVGIHPSNQNCFNQLGIDSGDKIILNTPSKSRRRNFNKKKELKNYSENELEEFILSNLEAKKRFMATFDLKWVDNQLPVGVFRGVKSNATKIFTGGKSAIDIWGINTKGEFCLFELKNVKNKKVGALSEMLYYSFIIQDVLNHVMEFNSDFDGLREIQNAKKIKCYLLAPSSHPLIDREVFVLLNKSPSIVEYRSVKIIDSLTFTVL